MRCGLDGWATNAPQSAAEHNTKAARIAVWWPAGFGYVLDTVSGVACLVAWLRVGVNAAAGRVALRLIIIASGM